MLTYKMMLEVDYPYTSGTTGVKSPCVYEASKGTFNTAANGAGGKSYASTEQTAASIMSAIDTKPSSVSIEADTLVFQTYSSGVITSSRCGTTLDHAVVAEGYNSTAAEPYYKVRNSWGAGWGEAGYVLIGMTESGLGICGIN